MNSDMKFPEIPENYNAHRWAIKRVFAHLEPDELCDFSNEVEFSEKYQTDVNFAANGDAAARQVIDDLNFVCETARDVGDEKGGCHLIERGLV